MDIQKDEEALSNVLCVRLLIMDNTKLMQLSFSLALQWWGGMEEDQVSWKQADSTTQGSKFCPATE